MFRRLAALALALALLGPALARAGAGEKLVFGLNWVAEAEYGGFYQALATGIYERYGLDVEIRQGGPQVPHAQLLAAGRLDLGLADNMLLSFNFVRQQVPVVAVAAFFQKPPQALLAHPDAGVEGFEDLRGRTLLIATEDRLSWWRWLKRLYGLSDDQVRPYTFSPAPFLADRNTVMQAYVTAEPCIIREVGGFEPRVLMLADAGWTTYANILQVRRELLERRPETVRRFIEASIEGWYQYLYGDPTPAHAAIRKANPEMSESFLACARRKLIDYGIVDSGEALTRGIGVMTEARWQQFYRSMVEAGVVEEGLPWREAYTLQFVGRGFGLDLKARLLQRP